MMNAVISEMPIIDYPVIVDYDNSLDWRDPHHLCVFDDGIAKLFRLTKRSGKKNLNFAVFGFMYKYSTSTVVSLMRQRGYRPAELREMMAWKVAYQEIRESPLVALDQNNGKGFAILFDDDDYPVGNSGICVWPRGVSDRLDFEWATYWRFAGVELAQGEDYSWYEHASDFGEDGLSAEEARDRWIAPELQTSSGHQGFVLTEEMIERRKSGESVKSIAKSLLGLDVVPYKLYEAFQAAGIDRAHGYRVRWKNFAIGHDSEQPMEGKKMGRVKLTREEKMKAFDQRYGGDGQAMRFLALAGNMSLAELGQAFGGRTREWAAQTYHKFTGERKPKIIR